MPDTPRSIYWDACVYLSYISEIPDRTPILESLLEDSSKGSIHLYTSEVSRVEVAFASAEKQQRALDEEVERRIDGLWEDRSVITMVEHHSAVSLLARTLVREAMTREWSLKPLDAIHLATAQWLTDIGINIDEFHTYDRRLDKFGTIVGYKIVRPSTIEPKMPL